ncbi:hypothetical protein [Sediminibacterium ginsengisoli]|uniref:Por secretion system C-terminal sorting domain-containing protein n=1 Tax=Sediminibacterium ginsengisoli TaxID=413434 RepID=A0A1T4M209_9BACT|nr:hypothetical protein [Sediminibacterium ginsengisoli]SJZ61039.1 hypothetical protein SAMN04488132_103122 [Sediminibacterium ginsengisoli]
MYIQSLQPNLVDTSSYLTVQADRTGRLILKVLDVEGRMAKTVVTNISEGVQQLVVNMSDLVSGRYIMNAFSGDVFIKSIKFEKQ